MPIGRVGRPHGLDGAFVVERASDDASRWEVGAAVVVDGEPARDHALAAGRRRPPRDTARPHRRARRRARRRLSELPTPGPDSYYEFQLVGLAVVDEDGGSGASSDVHPGVANDNLELADGTLVPMIEDAIRAVDLDAGRVVVVSGFSSG